MKKTKDRKIRISNLPDDPVIYKVVNKFRPKSFVLSFLGTVMLLFKIDFLIIIIALVCFYFILSLGDHVIFEVKENYLVYYLDKTYAKVIYYDEIINYQFKKLEYSDVKLIVLTDDEVENEFVLPDFNVIKNMDIVIGAKRVGK